MRQGPIRTDEDGLSEEDSVTRHLICAAILGLSGSVVASRQATPVVGASVDASEGTPVVVPRANQYDITSRINGETYRIMVSTPFEGDPAVAYPVLYLLDGNVHFNTATDALTRQSFPHPAANCGSSDCGWDWVSHTRSR